MVALNRAADSDFIAILMRAQYCCKQSYGVKSVVGILQDFMYNIFSNIVTVNILQKNVCYICVPYARAILL